MALDPKFIENNFESDYLQFATERIDVKIEKEPHFYQKYNLNLESSPVITETIDSKIYKIASRKDPQQLYALKYVPYGPRESDDFPLQYKQRASRKFLKWVLA